jgi:serine O-acetyltransferase
MKKLRDYIRFVKENDRSVHSSLEVFFLPGVQALVLHRLAHAIYKLKLYTLSRIVNSFSKFLTGVDIHPGAKIGKNFFIDHATGVVIGEQSVIGDNVVMYHSVTLGAKNQSTEAKRHPTIEDDVVIGCNSIILGDIIIHKGTKIRAGSIITKSI